MYVMPTVSPHGADVNSLGIEITTADHSRRGSRISASTALAFAIRAAKTRGSVEFLDCFTTYIFLEELDDRIAKMTPKYPTKACITRASGDAYV
jgi:hypothetical protein